MPLVTCRKTSLVPSSATAVLELALACYYYESQSDAESNPSSDGEDNSADESEDSADDSPDG
eukprot:COSAG06_NODE_49245_length_326_cov_3.004405_1_plen_61_part_10